jgi:hypothetical protein
VGATLAAQIDGGRPIVPGLQETIHELNTTIILLVSQTEMWIFVVYVLFVWFNVGL